LAVIFKKDIFWEGSKERKDIVKNFEEIRSFKGFYFSNELLENLLKRILNIHRMVKMLIFKANIKYTYLGASNRNDF